MIKPKKLQRDFLITIDTIILYPCEDHKTIAYYIGACKLCMRTKRISGIDKVHEIFCLLHISDLFISLKFMILQWIRMLGFQGKSAT